MRALVNHVVGEDRWTPPLLEGATIAEVGDRFDGDLLGDDPAAAARDAAAEAVASVAERVPPAGTVHLSYGDEDMAEYVHQLSADHLVHAWDLAAATGGDTTLDPELVAAMAPWFAEREELYRAGRGDRSAVSSTDRDDPAAQLLAAFGRDAGWSATRIASLELAFVGRTFDTGAMGFNNPSWTWSELEAALSGQRAGTAGRRAARRGTPAATDRRGAASASRSNAPTPGRAAPSASVPYAELHCHSNFSFLDGASHPEELATEAARLGLEALALTDHDGFYGVVRFAEAARAVGMPTVFGTEITLTPGLAAAQQVAREEADTLTQVATGRVPDSHAPDPHGEHLLLLADGPAGYARLARTLSLGHLAGEKGAPQFTLGDVARNTAGHVWVLTGCRKGAVPAALVADGPAAARRELQRLVEAFGRDRVLVELWDHGDPLDSARNDALAELAARHDVGCVATTNAHYATPAQRRLATALAAVRARRSLAELDPWLPAAAGAHLRSGAEQRRRFARYPGVVELAAEIGRAAAFDLSLVAPSLPPFPCPADGCV